MTPAEPDDEPASPDAESAASSVEPDDETIVNAAADAAEGVIFDRYKQSSVRDVDITVTFEDGVLGVDVYLDAPEGETDPETVADEAARAAQDAVDALFADELSE
ncbi:DUF3194 domain-containing protein [Halovivax cerinus]|uniref:DUF3194 domain-containing protein n=1 Tax=Halovivax cerinus TaxID=1487865 RepID=A0ABD5NL26_9EURY|nr:DUF3194 domain-containing protein [Halovivax cerinus]